MSALPSYGSLVQEALTRIVTRYGDAALALAIVVVGLVQVAGLDEPAWARVAGGVSVVALGVAAGFRVRAPLALPALLVAGIVLGTLLPKRIGDIEAMGFFLVLAVYSAAAHTGGRRTWVAGGLSVVLWLSALIGDPEELNLSGVLFFALLIGSPWLAGRIVRRRRLNEARLEQEKAAAEAAIVEERARIARELHDIVAHAISVVVIQARGGRRVLDDAPAEARQAFDTIERTSQQALVEMRRLLGLLRAEDEELALAPQPSLSRLEALAAEVRGAGLPVELEIVGDPVELPPGVDLSAYRIVQEALTNALKHAGPARARVVVSYRADDVELVVADDGAGTGNGPGTGHGLTGIRERVSVVGGDLDAGPQPDGGYAVRARLPYAAAR